MKERTTEILYRVADNPRHSLRLSSLMNDYHISEKTLRADIASAIKFATRGGKSLVELTGHHVRVSEPVSVNSQAIKSMLDGMDLYEYRLSPEERQCLIAVELLQLEPGAWLRVQEVADAFYCSYNTVTTDAKEMGTLLERSGIRLVGKSSFGLRVEATDEQRRGFLIGAFSRILARRLCPENYFLGVLEECLQFKVHLNDVDESVRAFLRSTNSYITIDAEHEISATLVVALNEIEIASASDDETVGDFDPIGSLVKAVAMDMGIRLGTGQVLGIERDILDRDMTPQIRRFDDFGLYCVISHFLMLVGKDLGVDLQGDDLLVEALFSHIKSSSIWDTDSFELDVSGEKEEASELVIRVGRACTPYLHIIEDYLHRPLGKGLRDSIVIHVCAALYRYESNVRVCNVLIACPSSAATGKYLEAQVKAYFKFNIIGITTCKEVEEGTCKLNSVDFVISTVPIDTDKVRVVNVSPVLSVEDINEIQELAFKLSRTKVVSCAVDNTLIARLSDIYQEGNANKVTYLDRELSRILLEVDQIEGKTRRESVLISNLKESFIQIVDDSLGWKDAIKRVSSPLLDEGFVTRGYIDKAIANVEEYGSYIIISHGIALAHAASWDGALKNGLSLLTCKDGITFDEGEEVSLMFFSSQFDSENYLAIFREINKLGSDARGFKRLCMSTSSEEVLRNLTEILSDYSTVLDE